MNTSIRAGHTFAFTGVLDAGDTLTASSGHHGFAQGAVIKVATTATNDGTIDLLAGPAHNGLQGATGAELEITGTLINNGLIDLSGGAYGMTHAGPVTGATLLDQGVLTNAGSILIGSAPSSGQPNAISGTGAALLNTGQLINSGVISIAGGEGTASGGTQGGTLIVSGSQLTNSGTLTVYGGSFSQSHGGLGGVLSLTAGRYLNNTGQLTVAGGDGAAGATLLDAGVLTNSGTLAFGSGFGVRLSHQNTYGEAGSLQVESSGSLDNAGLLTIGGGGSGTSDQVAGSLSNTGTLTLLGSGSSYFYAIPAASLDVTGVLTNQNLFTVEGGFGGGHFDDPYAGFGATLTDAGLLTNTGTLVVDALFDTYTSAGTAAVLAVTGSLVNQGTIILDGSLSAYGGAPAAATLNVAGTLANTGIITIDAGSTYGRFSGAGALLSDTGVLNNAGTIALLSSSGGSGGALIDSHRMVNRGVISVAAAQSGSVAATLSVTAGATLTNYGIISGGGVLFNQGEIFFDRSGAIATASLLNDGTIQFAPNTAFFINSAVYADALKSGVFNLELAATLTLYGSFNNNETVDFSGSDATLALGDARSFEGVLDDLGAASTLDFLGLDATSVTSSGTTLTIGLDMGKPLHLTLSVPLPAGTSLNLTSDENGGTDLLIHAPSSGT